MNNLGELDSEHFGRIKEVANAFENGKDIDSKDIFHSKSLISLIEKPKVILESFRLSDIYANYALVQRLFVAICPSCTKPEESEVLKEVLDHSDIVPILIADYSAYHPSIIKIVLQHPHISKSEFLFYRYAKLVSAAESRTCPHCIAELEKKVIENFGCSSFPPELKVFVKGCISNLHPFVAPDSDLLDILADILQKKDVAALNAIFGTSVIIRGIRTNQAFGSRSLLPARNVPKLIKWATETILNAEKAEVNQIYEAVSAPLELKFAYARPKDYFAIVNEHRNSLASIVEGFFESSTKNGEVALGKLYKQLEELNEELKSLHFNKRYLAYKAALGFLHKNKVVAASMLAAGALGLAGEYFGCGALAVSGVGAKFGLGKLRQSGKLKATPETEAFLGQVKASVRPHLHKLLSSYAGVSLSAIQIAEISEDIKQRTRKVPSSKRVKDK